MAPLSQTLSFLMKRLEAGGDFSLALYSVAEAPDGKSPYLHPEMGHHRNPCCLEVKRDGACHQRCVQYKNEKIRHAYEVRAPFMDLCPFGVLDLVFPIPEEDPQFILFLSPNRRHRDKERGGTTLRPVNVSELGHGPELSVEATMVRDLIADLLTAHRAEWVRMAPAGLLGKKVSLARHNVRHNSTQPWSLAAMAKQLHVNPTVLAREYRKAWGVTLHQDLNQSRIDMAKGLLHGGATVTQAAHDSGYNDALYFSRVFRRVTGVSPKSWRDRYGKRRAFRKR